jgi:predicted nucleotidyltransferase
MIGNPAIGATPGKLTPYVELDQVLTGYGHTLRDVLGGNFVGLYLLGSLAIGDFDLTSDVDFVIVTRRELSPDEVGLVQSAHTELVTRDTRWVKHLEYSVFPIPKLSEKSSPYSPQGRDDSEARQLWYFMNGSSIVERSDHDNTLVTRWTLRYKSKAVLGPEPETFAPEVAANELRQEIKSSMLGWEHLFTPASPLNNRFHQVFFVLNNCRALQDLHEGRITSKREGANWAKQHLDPRWHALIDYCWQERQDTSIHVSQPADPQAFTQTVAFIEHTTRLAEKHRVAD